LQTSCWLYKIVARTEQTAGSRIDIERNHDTFGLYATPIIAAPVLNMMTPCAPSTSNRSPPPEAAGLNSHLRSLYERLEARTAAQTKEFEILRNQYLDLKSLNYDQAQKIVDLERARHDKMASHKEQMERCRQHVAKHGAWPDEGEDKRKYGDKTMDEYIDGLDAKMDEMRLLNGRLSERVGSLLEGIGQGGKGHMAEDGLGQRNFMDSMESARHIGASLDKIFDGDAALSPRPRGSEMSSHRSDAHNGIERQSRSLITTPTRTIQTLRRDKQNLIFTIEALTTTAQNLTAKVKTLESDKQKLKAAVDDVQLNNAKLTSTVQSLKSANSTFKVDTAMLSMCSTTLSHLMIPHLFALVIGLHMRYEKLDSELDQVLKDLCAGIAKVQCRVAKVEAKIQGEGEEEEEEEEKEKGERCMQDSRFIRLCARLA
jgi:hypothetical protein